MLAAPPPRPTRRARQTAQMALVGLVGVCFGLWTSTVWAAGPASWMGAAVGQGGGCANGLLILLDMVASASGVGDSAVHEQACPAFRGIGFAFLLVAALVVLGVARMRSRVEQRRLDLARTLLEQGREPPSDLLRGSHAGDLRKGIVLLFAGLGVVLTAVVMSNHGLMSGGLIPGFIGLGYLVSYRIGGGSRGG